MPKQSIRCAIYTRKSSEEGLDQSFNSLEAQREACCAYILSQKHEGWTVLATHYDDGGISGGTMERPGLQQLLSDIQASKIDTVVVYKVDRLTRSLADFAKIIEIFDSKSVSFVSVTQHFNTTSSMGRLTLNVLLSFAQFEREITGERIRDKIAASKKKGMWMGGNVPLGYDNVGRHLVVNPSEAETVLTIFRQYLRLGCISKLKQFLDQNQIGSKALARSAERRRNGNGYSRGALHHLLNNRVYVGETIQKKESYKGQHPAIVSRELWDQVSASLKKNNQAHRTGRSRSTPSLLSGKLFDENGVRFTPTHSTKSSKRYRYYTSQTLILQADNKPAVTRFPAQELEQFVISQIHLLLQDSEKFTIGIKNDSHKATTIKKADEIARSWPHLEISKQHEFIANILRRVTVGDKAVGIEIDRTKLLATLLGPDSVVHPPSPLPKSGVLKIASEYQVLRRGGELRVIAPYVGWSLERAPMPSLVKVIAQAHRWYEQIINGEIGSIDQLAQQSGLTKRYVRRILQCANLSPQITKAILRGQHRPTLTVKCILRDVPLYWKEQEKKIMQTF